MAARDFDLLALASAFFAAVAIQPLLAFRSGDYATADAAAFAITPSVGPISISSGVSFWSSLSSVLTTLSLIASVVGRAIATAEGRMSGTRRALLHRLATPFIVLATGPLAVSIVVFPSALYYSGFIMFPDAITYTPRWFWMGLSFALIAAVIIVYALGLAVYFNCINKKEPSTPPTRQLEPTRDGRSAWSERELA